MTRASRSSLPKAPLPTRVFFDPFNSSSTGHQRAENRLSGSTSWRDSRQHKLAHQFRDQSGGGGHYHLSDLVGAGSINFKVDGRKDNGDWEPGAPGLREKGWQDIRHILSSTKRSREGDEDHNARKKCRINPSVSPTNEVSTKSGKSPREGATPSEVAHDLDGPKNPQIFKGLTMYLNGSTMPLISDHRLKQLWVQHGGSTSISLGRRTVTHVILAEKGVGGGLASGKIQKENITVRGKGIKYVTAQWVLDSIEKGVRRLESHYMQAELRNKLGGAGQQSVASLFRTT